MPASDALTKIVLDESDIPTHWYNVVSDLPKPPAPVLHPGTGQPVGPADLAPLFPMALIGQEVSQDTTVEIPDEVRDVYRLWRPTPLFRARRLERALDTPAHIYYKYEGVSPAGSHKPNTAVAQAYYNKAEGIRRLTTETGAGQWGSALAFACAAVRPRVHRLHGQGQLPAEAVSALDDPDRTAPRSSPHPPTARSRARRCSADQPDSPGSLGIAISEAVEDAATHDDAHYSLGSVLNHVLLHQTVIGQEALKQMDMAGEYPDVVIGCVGGGSNFAGLAFPFVGQKLREGRKTRIVAVEPEACPTLTRGSYAYDFGDTVGLTPLVKMHTLGHSFVPPAIHAGGLRYHGAAPLLIQLVDEAVDRGAGLWPERRLRGRHPVRPQRGHRARARVRARHPRHDRRGAAAREAGERRVILFNLSGHGHFDMGAYDAYLAGALQDYAYPAEAIQAGADRAATGGRARVTGQLANGWR